MSLSVSSLSGRVVGLFEGRNVFTDGSGLYILVQQGDGGPLGGDRERRFIRKTDYGLIRLFDDVNLDLRQLASSVGVANGGGATLRQRQEGSSSAPNSNGDGFSVSPLGNRYRIVTEGTGRVPTLNDRVKVDDIWWRDAFDSQNNAFFDRRGKVWLASDWVGCLREAMLSMREGETRQVIIPADDRYYPRYVQLRLVSIE
ncbi:unnamed protein product [Vitrella brassicaformis CCMP3155]|uniref:Uncharacterized protein n=1 Tax=Vitrella brassicaformis (strain CCMP3155) TaxID=1169540 RepID=A0A0G4H4N6_VITBC|nr:unnamed protein product [Vitrella brassicaformis CCMP3155]|eukprot:CEM38754.1 unnamed protein product [Vitrella brassicaformis CCMP3155]